MKRQRDVSVRDGTRDRGRRRVIEESQARKVEEGSRRTKWRVRKQKQKKAEESWLAGWRETRHDTMGKINR